MAKSSILYIEFVDTVSTYDLMLRVNKVGNQILPAMSSTIMMRRRTARAGPGSSMRMIPDFSTRVSRS